MRMYLTLLTQMEVSDDHAEEEGNAKAMAISNLLKTSRLVVGGCEIYMTDMKSDVHIIDTKKPN